VRIEVPGIPAPQGSKNRGANGQLYEANKNLPPWRDSVIWHVRKARNGAPALTGPVLVTMLFVFPRPKSHYGTGRNAGALKPGAPLYHTSKPDRDKLERAIHDALKIGGVFKDDSQSAAGGSKKIYGARPGCRITVEALEGN